MANKRRISLGIVAVILLVIVAISYRQWRQYTAANQEASETRQIIDSVDRVLLAVVDAETGERGYLITGDDRYLEPYNQAVQAIPNELLLVQRLLSGRPGELSNVTRLNELASRKLMEVRETIDMRRINGAAAATGLVRSDQGKQTMDAIRALCAEIERLENATQTQASVEREAAAQTAVLVTIAGSLVLLFLFALGL
jgi:CHASE3 domain sensor protein